MDAKEILNQSRSHGDMKNWSKNISGKEYYQNHPHEKNTFRTIWVKDNPFTGKPQAHISNWVPNAVPPPNIPHIHPLHLQKLMTLQTTGDFY